MRITNALILLELVVIKLADNSGHTYQQRNAFIVWLRSHTELYVSATGAL